MDRPQVRVDPFPIPPLRHARARIQRRRITDAIVIKDNNRAQTHSCRVQIEECLKVTPQGAERLDRRSEMISEALAEEVRRNDQNEGDGAEIHQQHHHHKQQQHHMH